MMKFEQLKAGFLELPEEAQNKVIDYLEFIQEKYQVSSGQSQYLNLEAEPFVGMWENRLDTQNSSEWVHEIRRQQWERNG